MRLIAIINMKPKIDTFLQSFVQTNKIKLTKNTILNLFYTEHGKSLLKAIIH